MVPFHPIAEYTGRVEVGARLKELCLPSRTAEESNKIFVLWGIGGSGKTQTCLKFAQGWRER